MAEKLNYEHCLEVAKRRGFELLSTEYVNNSSKLQWRCSVCKYEWPASLAKISTKNPTGCPECAGCVKYTIEDAHEIAKLKGGKCLSDRLEPILGVHSKLQWECEFGHTWPATFNHVRRNTWCPDCNGLKQKTVEDCQHLASKNNGKFVSEKYTHANDKTLLWECEVGHKWPASYASIYSGTWCDECSIGKSQKLLTSVLKEIIPNKQIFNNYRGFDWLKNKKTKKKLELDIYVPDLKLAIEYDGQQHFKPVCFGGVDINRARKNFQKQKRLDKIKNKLVAKNSQDVVYFIRYRFDEPITKEILLLKLKNIGVVI